MNRHLRRKLDNFEIESFQSPDAMQNLHCRLDFGLGDDSWIDDDSQIFGSLYYRAIVKCIQFLLQHVSFQTHLDFELVRLPDSKGRQICSDMNTSDWSWDT
jgi:hypothetical protein